MVTVPPGEDIANNLIAGFSHTDGFSRAIAHQIFKLFEEENQRQCHKPAAWLASALLRHCISFIGDGVHLIPQTSHVGSFMSGGILADFGEIVDAQFLAAVNQIRFGGMVQCLPGSTARDKIAQCGLNVPIAGRFFGDVICRLFGSHGLRLLLECSAVQVHDTVPGQGRELEQRRPTDERKNNCIAAAGARGS